MFKTQNTKLVHTSQRRRQKNGVGGAKL